MNLIVEVKIQSPFGYRSEEDFDAQLDYARQVGDWVSIHTSPVWGGSFVHVRQAAQKIGQPILAKGIHPLDDEIRRAMGAGATKVLVLGRLPHHKLLEHCWLEPVTLKQLRNWISLEIPIVWNFQDLRYGGRKKIPWRLVEKISLLYPATPLIVASFIKHPLHIPKLAWGAIVGENLKEYVKNRDAQI